ncbi:MAG: DNA-directed RNA polymerase subunit omega [Alphaproteobacteria bacterium]|nr:DNA-directed RNA polymerase subunit omega [Alphaproteobacteria bacterium]
MARITVEDCEKVVNNRFDLVVLAAQRTRQILAGDAVTIDADDEKKPVIALREIAARAVSVDDLKEAAINSFRSFLPSEDEEEDPYDISEEDTYNPYEGLSVKAIEKEGVQVVSENEIENSDGDRIDLGDSDSSEVGGE